jgi:hypothetical protein
MIVRPVRHRPACRGVRRETFAVDPLEASNYRAAGYGGGVIEHVCARHSRNAERARSPAEPATGAPPADARSPAGASVIARSGRHAGGLVPMKVSARSVDGSRSNRDLRALARADLGLVRVTVVITASQACPHANRAPPATPQPSRSRTAVGAARRSGRGSGALSSSAASAQLHKLCRATIHAFHLTIRRHLERPCCEYCIELDAHLCRQIMSTVSSASSGGELGRRGQTSLFGSPPSPPCCSTSGDEPPRSRGSRHFRSHCGSSHWACG